MATRQTFHTPSFGDEEFEILTAPTYDHHQQSAAELSLNIQPASASLSSPSSSFHSTTTALPIATNQSSIANQWHFTDFQTQSIGSGTIPIIGYGGNTVVMGDNNVIIGDEDEQRYSTIAAEDSTLMTNATSSTATTIAKLNSKQSIKKRDPNEPPKPVSAYALFFRDTQTPIKGQNPDASFGEISKIVASMWDALDPEHKNVYKKKSELAKKEYLKSLAAYKESVNSKSPKDILSGLTTQNNDIQQNHNNSTLNPITNTEYISSTPATIIQTNKPLESNIQTASPIVSVLRSPIQNSSLTQCIPSAVTGYTSPNQPTTVHVAQIKNSQIQQKLETPMQQQQQQQQNLAQQQNLIATTTNNPANIVSESSTQQIQKCIREGCNNNAIVNPDWEDEYCSNECVIIHCRDVFSQWVLSNNSNNVIVTTDSFQTAA